MTAQRLDIFKKEGLMKNWLFTKIRYIKMKLLVHDFWLKFLLARNTDSKLLIKGFRF